MEFHVWDFPEVIEVRLNDDLIDRIRNMTVKKKIRVRDKKLRSGYGWRSQHLRDFTMEKEVKLIAFRVGHPYHKIAERLYAKTDWHGSDRPMTQHKPFINIREFLTVHKITGIPLEEMERNVIEVRNHWAGHIDFPIKFPVVANEDWAWLFGLWFAAGGLITRTRNTKGYPTTERSVRFRIDENVFEEKVKPILERIGYIPKLFQVWYDKKGLMHPKDRGRRKGVGGLPRRGFVLLRPVREIMEKFGLPREQVSQKHKAGAKFGVRKFNFVVPGWIKEKKEYTHAFIEAYINAVGASIFHPAKEQLRHHLVRNAEIRFGAFDRNQVEDFYKFFEIYLTERGIPGYRHEGLHAKISKLYWLGYLVLQREALCRMFEIFDIRKPDLRARLLLNYKLKSNLLLYEALRKLNSSEILVLGCLMERQLSQQELSRLLRCDPKNISEALVRLDELSMISKTDEKYTVDLTGFRDKLIEELQEKEKKRTETILRNNQLFYSRCKGCGKIIPENYTGPCDCGGQYEPISRMEAIYRHGYALKIRKIKDQKLPTFLGCKQ